ncbi:MAG: hypothetical protein M1836_006663 [Candelina mexicana]|nr:MAG: hypothetical protein M1836_006663 [Candelina mexicana]
MDIAPLPSAPSASQKAVKNSSAAPRYALPRMLDPNTDSALLQATLLQQRQEFELQILDATETLIDFPSLQSADPAHPDSAEATLFKTLLTLFQPADYDSLIHERNINGKCGYALCPRTRQMENTRAKFRILRGKGNPEDFQVIPRAHLEQWCSEECAKRALYLKVQLDEQPAWMRVSPHDVKLVLLNELKIVSRTDTPRGVLPSNLKENTNIPDEEENREQRAMNAQHHLALERGDRRDSPGLVEVTLRENPKPLARQAGIESMLSQLRVSGTSSSSIEGYTPKDVSNL